MAVLSLIGYRATGKSTVARLLSAVWDGTSIDADDEIERLAGCSIREIFAGQGEPAFRDFEQQVVDRLTRASKLVIAMGGGAILREANRAAMKRGKVVWLTAEVDTIWARLNSDETTTERRPGLTDLDGYKEIETVLAARLPIYEQCADWIVSTEGKSAQQVADEIVSLVGNPFNESTS